MTSRPDRLRVVVAGMVAGVPGFAGASWAVLQYVLGLRRLGHEVVLVEPLPAPPSAEVLAWFELLLQRFSLAGAAALLAPGREAFGRGSAAALAAASSSDVLINVSGMLTDEAVLAGAATRVFLDLDPAFVQIWHSQGIDMHLDSHDRFVTVGQQLGGDSSAPTCGRDWLPTLPPVVLEHWPLADRPAEPGYTTVATWRGYGSVTDRGVFHGQKAHSLRPLMPLPAAASAPFRLALSISPEEEPDLRDLAAHGWQLLDPRAAAGTPDGYQSFLQSSWAEFGLAKHGYVVSRSGWFSDRSACYLACGRPVLAQDTGFSARLPTGEGLLTFRDASDFCAADEALRSQYARHRAAARALAQEHLDSDRVLTRLLEQVA